MTDPKAPRPPHYAKADQALLREHVNKLAHETIPDTKRHASELDAKRHSDIMAMARVLTAMQHTNTEAFSAIQSKLLGLQVHAIDVHAYVTRHGWAKHPLVILAATILGAAVGGYIASKT
jgi:hypothetical protein